MYLLPLHADDRPDAMSEVLASRSLAACRDVAVPLVEAAGCVRPRMPESCVTSRVSWVVRQELDAALTYHRSQGTRAGWLRRLRDDSDDAAQRTAISSDSGVAGGRRVTGLQAIVIGVGVT